MKLRTRIISISLITVLISTLIINIVTISFMWKSTKNEAFLKAYKNSYAKIQDFEDKFENLYKSQADDRLIEYYFKIRRDELVVGIGFSDEESEDGDRRAYEIWNHTVFGIDKLRAFDYKEYEEGINYSYVNYANKKYIVFTKEISDMGIYIFEDITYASDNIRKIIIVSAAITFFVITIAIFTLYKILNREFKPLSELSDMTKRIADNKYDQRVVVHNNDEIGQIAQNFNKMADAVEYRTKNLEESEKRKTLFMGNLTHELKTPMTSISGYAQTLLSVKLNEDDRAEALNYIYKECTRLERLSQKMMKLLELNHEDELEFKQVSSKDLFEAAAKSCSAILRNKNITLVYEEHGEKFMADFDLMTDVIINLIDNSVKASDAGGKIILRSYGKCIEVEDFGKGIPVEEQEKIMEPFYMVDKSRSRKSGGAGLGLALTELIIKKHNAVIKIDSHVGSGTKIILQFV